MRNSNSLKQTIWIRVFDINFHQFSMIFIKFFKKKSKFCDHVENLWQGETRATEFSQTSRLHHVNLHAFISWETHSHLNPTAGSRAMITFVPWPAQK